MKEYENPCKCDLCDRVHEERDMLHNKATRTAICDRCHERLHPTITAKPADPTDEPTEDTDD